MIFDYQYFFVLVTSMFENIVVVFCKMMCVNRNWLSLRWGVVFFFLVVVLFWFVLRFVFCLLWCLFISMSFFLPVLECIVISLSKCIWLLCVVSSFFPGLFMKLLFSCYVSVFLCFVVIVFCFLCSCVFSAHIVYVLCVKL